MRKASHHGRKQQTIEFMRRNLSYCIESLTKTPMVYSVSYFYLGGLGTLFGGDNPTNPPPNPRGDGTATGVPRNFYSLETVPPWEKVWGPLLYMMFQLTLIFYPHHAGVHSEVFYTNGSFEICQERMFVKQRRKNG